ncbi:hypothetical protein JXB02_04555 [Candidatus Woesearchaeota archaeon]|nr:hypothetical protein [Candidatus Woesearchaeota archaeon]
MNPPQYEVRQSLGRIIIPSFFHLVILCMVLYLGIWINLYLLKIKVGTDVHIMIILAIDALMIVQLLIVWFRHKGVRYDFFLNRIDIMGEDPKEIYYAQVQYVNMKRDLWDKAFGTATLELSPSFAMPYVRNYPGVYTYLTKLIAYARSMGFAPQAQAYRQGTILAQPVHQVPDGRGYAVSYNHQFYHH